jgi:hypothetical protein
MLNSEGGVILFDCIQEYRSVVPQGELMSQREKEEF